MTPLAAQAICQSTSNIFSIELGTMRDDPNLLSTAKTTPSSTLSPTALDPN